MQEPLLELKDDDETVGRYGTLRVWESRQGLIELDCVMDYGCSLKLEEEEKLLELLLRRRCKRIATEAIRPFVSDNG